MIAVLLGLVSLIGCAGLYKCHPRPDRQEAWAIIALTPLFALVAYAFMFGALR